MKVGTKSVLYGAHCFLLHPWFVAAGWRRLYGFPWDPRLWVAFFVHDLGYWGKPNMDGPEGELHPFLGAKIMGRLFDYRSADGDFAWNASWFARSFGRAIAKVFGVSPPGGTSPDLNLTWYCFTFYHSRFLAKRYGTEPTRLCAADKLSIALTPGWLYLPMARWTGEIHEYRRDAKAGKYAHMRTYRDDERAWHAAMQAYLCSWVAEFVKNGGRDRLTQAGRKTTDKNGVWK
jgi:hypothetical protein